MPPHRDRLLAAREASYDRVAPLRPGPADAPPSRRLARTLLLTADRPRATVNSRPGDGIAKHKGPSRAPHLPRPQLCRPRLRDHAEGDDGTGSAAPARRSVRASWTRGSARALAHCPGRRTRPRRQATSPPSPRPFPPRRQIRASSAQALQRLSEAPCTASGGSPQPAARVRRPASRRAFELRRACINGKLLSCAAHPTVRRRASRARPFAKRGSGRGAPRGAQLTAPPEPCLRRGPSCSVGTLA